MHRIKKVLASLAFVVGLSAGIAGAPAPLATAAVCSNGPQCVQNGVDKVNSGNETDLVGTIKTIVNVLLYVTGAVAVIMIIIGGFRYVISAGDGSSVTSAKNTILYAVVGLVVAILAFAIVNFVVDNL